MSRITIRARDGTITPHELPFVLEVGRREHAALREALLRPMDEQSIFLALNIECSEDVEREHEAWLTRREDEVLARADEIRARRATAA